MNYSVFCNALTMSLSARLEPETKLFRKMIPKNNGVLLDSVLFMSADEACSPVIYLEPLYEYYKAGSSMDTICRSVLSCLERHIPFSSEFCFRLHDPEYVKNLITFRLVSQKRNETLLKDVPWIPFLDLAIVFYLCLESNSDGQVSAFIHNRLSGIWNLSPKQLLSHAKINTPALFPSVLTRLEDVLHPLDTENSPAPQKASPRSALHVLTNQNNLYGAACMLYENPIKDFADRMESDIIILPSSIHEVLLIPDFHFFDYDALCRMVQDINTREVTEEEILSDCVYLYGRNSRSFRIWPSPSSYHTP